MNGDLTKTFDTARKESTGETLEKMRGNYYIALNMRGSDDNTLGGLNINTSGRANQATIAKKKVKQYTDGLLMVALQDQLAAIESAMADKYGEDFAENLAAEFLDEETYKAVIAIEDPEERRRAIARAINEGIKNGTTDPDEVYKNPDFKEWLDKHAEREEYEVRNAAIGKITSSDLDASNTEEAALDVLFSDTPTFS
ncbi:MAG: hypothetical protein AB2551_11005 [Candidatus Thiodiazotropha sp.]